MAYAIIPQNLRPGPPETPYDSVTTANFMHNDGDRSAAAPAPAAESADEPEKTGEGAEVVRLDRFRKK